MSPAEVLQSEIVSKGKEIFASMQDESVSIFRKDYWNGKIMEWCMGNEAFKVEMFRFVDVLPALESAGEVARHIREYFCRDGLNFPAGIQSTLGFIGSNVVTSQLAARSIKKNVTEMAKMFIAGENAAEAMPALLQLRKQNIAFTVDILGEAAVSEAEALDYQRRYMDLLETLVKQTAPWQHSTLLEEDADGAIPRVNVSVKLSSLFSQADALDWEGSLRVFADRLRPILLRAKELGVFINIDMEQYTLKALTLGVLKKVLDEPAFHDFHHIGIAMQAYLKDCLTDLEDLVAWCQQRNRRITIRLVKGAYWDYETVLAKQNDWPVPVFTDKRATDANYERCSEYILQNHQQLKLALGSHNLRSVSNALVQARRLGIPNKNLEIQMLFGMAEPIKKALSAQGYRVRDYVPVGELIPGMAYLVRRLLENTSNESWLRQKFVQNVDVEQLLSDPKSAAQFEAPSYDEKAESGVFRNQPVPLFHRSEDRQAMTQALAAVRKSIVGQDCLPWIGKNKVKSSKTIASVNPSKFNEVVGLVHLASIEDAEKALELARKAQPAWEDFGPQGRANVLFKAAGLMTARRWELSALMVLEEGKPWREAVNDTNEAIDFLNYYAREMLRLGEPQRLMREVSGELNHLFYQARGVGLVIAPWNFPLAIPTGMVSAALVAGNAVIFKPAEQASVIGLKMVEILREAGVPADVLAYLPGKGSEVGAHLVAHKDIDFIVFTGSREVGLEIVKQAAITHPRQKSVKKVVAEMGGKNAIIVDSDADLDEAVRGVIYSAFGYAGQKCSACSRVIVLPENYDRFVNRLVEAARSIAVGPSEDPAHYLGPVIDEKAKASIENYIKIGMTEGKVLLQREAPQGGYFVGPTIIEVKDGNARIAQEEIFGPVLAVIKAKDFDHALEIANATDYALTGGLFSRSPENIARVRREFRVGNLYINRGCTGALVGRHPFGGFKMSGVGSKAGGPDYLMQFLEPRAVSENTLRRGFAPEE